MLLQVQWDIKDEDIENYKLAINQVVDQRYVFYDPENGAVNGISNNSADNNLPYVTVNYSEVEKIFEGLESSKDYKVIFSPDEKDYILIKKEIEEEVLNSINDIIFQIPFRVDSSKPVIYDVSNDITIIQDYTDTCWKIYINTSLAKSLKAKNLYFDNSIQFYITSFNDPNILYRTLDVSLKHLVNDYYQILPFSKTDYNETRVSIFCRKLFSKYEYIRTKI